jgi:hypothetical protein
VVLFRLPLVPEIKHGGTCLTSLSDPIAKLERHHNLMNVTFWEILCVGFKLFYESLFKVFLGSCQFYECLILCIFKVFLGSCHFHEFLYFVNFTAFIKAIIDLCYLCLVLCVSMVSCYKCQICEILFFKFGKLLFYFMNVLFCEFSGFL